MSSLVKIKGVGEKKLEAVRENARNSVAAVPDMFVEETIRELMLRVQGPGVSQVALAGGLFANVKVNQRLLELPSVSNVFVQPAMGDDGLSLGAALLGLLDFPTGPEALAAPIRPSRFEDTFLGPEYSSRSAEAAADRLGCAAIPLTSPEKHIARWLSEGRIVGVHSGRMEFGPRALGHRSILASPTSKDINATLNQRLQRTEFMPFAPSILAEHAAEYLDGWHPFHRASEFMTLTYSIPEQRRTEIPAVVHVDGTARPQVVHRERNPRYWKIIDEYRRLSGIPAIVNTSFNAHEEPIVCKPEDAIRSFLAGRVDELVVGNARIHRQV
jgi:carbamoyltransferase